MAEMSDDQRRRAKQSMVDAANMGTGQMPGPVGELQQALSNRLTGPSQPDPQEDPKKLQEAALRNAQINHQLMMQQIAQERAAKQAIPVEPQQASPEVDLAALSDTANQMADQQMYPDRFKNLKKHRGK